MIKQTSEKKATKRHRIFVKKNPFRCTKFNPENQNKAEIYSHIIRKSLKKSVPNTERKGQAPTAIILAGPTAAGKSSVINRFIRNQLGRTPNQFAYISVDLVMELLPEYQQAIDMLSHLGNGGNGGNGGDIEDLLPDNMNPAEKAKILEHLDEYIMTAVSAADDCRNESRDITRKLLLPQVLDEQRDFVYDSTARNVPYYQNLIQELKELGYTVIVVYVTASLGVIKSRAKARASETGRVVPENIIKMVFNAMKKRKVFDTLCRSADTCYLYNNQNRPILAVEKDLDGFLRCHDMRYLGDIVNTKDCDSKYV